MTRATTVAPSVGRSAARCTAASWLSAALLLLLCTGLPGQRAGLPGLPCVQAAAAEVHAVGVVAAAEASDLAVLVPARRPLATGPRPPRRTHSLREHGLPAPRAP